MTLEKDLKVTLFLVPTISDRDGDGTPDDEDAFPDDPDEQSDLDRDGVGDNSDLDRDGDGYSNSDEEQHGGDANEKNITPPDLDGDFKPDAIDEDRDGDGISNVFEEQLGTNPDDASQAPIDSDGDGLPDVIDQDRDGDGVENDQDVFPDDRSESSDLDNDGLGDNSDDDIDGDGFSNDVELQLGNDEKNANDTPPDIDGDKIPDVFDEDKDGDGVKNEQDDYPEDPDKFLLEAQIIIDSPVSGFVTRDTQVVVSGSIVGDIDSIRVEDQQAVIDGEVFSATIELREGANKITAVGRYQTLSGPRSANATKNIILDTTPPEIIISSVADGMVTTSPAITIAGSLDDLRSNLSVNQAPTVTVNGISIEVINRSFELANYSLRPGLNVLNIQATDPRGNSKIIQRKVIYLKQAGQKIIELGGNNQQAQVGEILSHPLSVKLVDRNNLPIASRAATFKISEGDGAIVSGNRISRTMVLLSNEQGIIQADYQLGKRSGAGNHQVTVSAIGFPGKMVFSASAHPLLPAKLSVARGGRQTGMMGSLLPEPLIARVTDNNGNPLQGVDVMFEVESGGGHFLANDGSKSTSITVSSDFDGNAIQGLVLGSTLESLGFDSQLVLASVVGMPELNTTFVANNSRPGAIEETKISGLVLDNSNQPLPDVEVKIMGNFFNTRETITDAQGMFLFDKAPVGTVHLVLDGSTTSREGEWPHLMFELVTISGKDNTVEMPIYFPEVDYDGGKIAGGDRDIIIPMRNVEGAEVIIPANSMTFPDGRKTGRVMFTQVQSDKVPMPAPNGSAFEVAWTLQPAGIHFDPPARVSLPNSFGGTPGEEMEMFSFDHDLMEWVSIGPGVVSDDGAKITSRLGHGIRHSGWGGAPPPPDDKCYEQCNGTECYQRSKIPGACACSEPKLIKGKLKSNQIPDNCQLELCGDSPEDNLEDNDDKPADEQGDCQIPTCKNKQLKYEEDLSDEPIDGSAADDPNDCVDKTCIGPPAHDDSEVPSEECRKCERGISVEDSSHRPKGDEFQKPDDCKVLFCDEKNEYENESANLPDNDLTDCRAPACNDKGWENSPGQHKFSEKEECKEITYSCSEDGKNVPEEKKYRDGKLVEGNKCRECQGGEAIDIAVDTKWRVASGSTLNLEIPVGAIDSLNKKLKKLPRVKIKVAPVNKLKHKRKERECCSEDKGKQDAGEAEDSLEVSAGISASLDVLPPFYLNQKDLGVDLGFVGYVKIDVSAVASLGPAVGAGISGILGRRDSSCNESNNCVFADLGVVLGLGAKGDVSALGCIRTGGVFVPDADKCGLAGVELAAAVNFSWKYSTNGKECGAPSGVNFDWKGVTLDLKFIVTSGATGKLRDVPITIPFGPYFL
ncbi:hypothetical protein DC094_15990 [Pelagibaculum spongiae]|uniref:Carboxypeptidase regulatory-like domain-containing protein n=1 Tax=Pelagibaculum spongiae TaxID=2080658 RepID=A0A2V1GS24_9GAMM|nr:hypothetical protein DC094_15990 [Pelagibaculum spongiae]